MQMKDVIISVTGMQENMDGPDSMELVTAGRYGITDEGARMEWEESELTGMEGTHTTLTVKERLATLERSGTTATTMEFEEGKKHYFLYETPFGSATMGLNTNRMQSNLGLHGGELSIEYIIDMDSQVVGRNRFFIRVEEPKPSHTGDIRWPI